MAESPFYIVSHWKQNILDILEHFKSVVLILTRTFPALDVENVMEKETEASIGEPEGATLGSSLIIVVLKSQMHPEYCILTA